MATGDAQQPDTPVLRIRSLCKTYGSGESAVHALRDVNLDVRSGEFLVLLGASGSGKSTLLNILGGLDVPSSGEVEFFDHRLTDATDNDLTRYRREHVGFVFQFYNLIPSLTVRENVALVTDIASDPMPVDEALALVALTPGATIFPPSFPAASSSVLPSRGPPSSVRSCCCATNRPGPWTMPPASWYSKSLPRSTWNWEPRPWSSPTTLPSPAWQTG